MVWGSSQELYAFIPYRCKVEQPDDLQHNRMTNSETEMCKWKLGVLLRALVSGISPPRKSSDTRVI